MEAFVHVPDSLTDHQLANIQPLVIESNALFDAGKYEEALAFVSQAIFNSTGYLKNLEELSPDGRLLLLDLYHRRASICSKLGNHAQVLSDATEMLLLDPQQEKGHVLRGAALMQLGRPEEAAAEFQVALRTAPTNAAYRQYLCEAEAACGRPVRSNLSMDDSSPSVGSTPMLETYVQLPETVSDQQLFRIQSLVAKANHLYHKGQYQEALDLLSDAICTSTATLKSFQEVGPSGKMLLSNLYNRRAATAFKLGDYEQVLCDSTEMVVLGFQLDKAHVRRGGALMRLGRPDEACLEYEAALVFHPHNAAYRQYLQEAQAACGRSPREPILEPSSPASPSRDAESQAVIHEKLKRGNKVFFAPEPDYIEAFSYYDAALRRLEAAALHDVTAAVTRHQVLSRRAQTLHQLQRFGEAIADAEQMIRLAPHSEKGYVLKAKAYMSLAQHTLEEGVRHMPSPRRRQVLQDRIEAAATARLT